MVLLIVRLMSLAVYDCISSYDTFINVLCDRLKG